MSKHTSFHTLVSFLFYLLFLFIKPISGGGNQINFASSFFIFILLSALSWLYYLMLKNIDIKTNTKYIFLVSFLFSSLLFFTKPIGSNDIYAYIPYGRIVSHNNQNPYVTTYEQLKDDKFYDEINHPWKNKTTPYAPLFTLIQSVVTAAGGNNYSTTLLLFRTLFVLFFFASIYILYKITRAPISTALFALNPLVIFEFVQNGHTDILTIFLLLVSILLITKFNDLKHLLLGICFLTTSIFIKYTTIFLAPLYIFLILKKKGKFAGLVLAPLIASAIAAILCLPFWKGYSVFLKVLDYYKFQSYQASIGVILASIPLNFLGTDNALLLSGIVNKIIFFASTIYVYLKALQNINTKNFVFYIVIILTLFLGTFFTWFMPWYPTILIPLLAILSSQKVYQDKAILFSTLVTLYGALNYIILDY